MAARIRLIAAFVTLGLECATTAVASRDDPPPAPAGLHCITDAAAVTSLLAVCRIDPEVVDFVSFEVALADDSRGWPFLHYTSAADADGSVRANIPGLRPGTKYTLQARSHRRGRAEDARDGTWSEVVAADATCETLAGGGGAAADLGRPPPRPAAAEEAAARRARGVGTEEQSRSRPWTRWLEVYRTAELGNALPDFLDNHNSGDLGGDFGFLSLCGLQCPFLNFTGRVAITRYCVEMEYVVLPNISTVSTLYEPQASPYSDYASCNQIQGMAPHEPDVDYRCGCDNLIDRVFAHYPAAKVREACPGPTPTFMRRCHCSNRSSVLTSRYIGMMPLPLPIFGDTEHMEENNETILPPAGHWFSHPYEGRCPLGAHVGDGGCTWQRSRLSHSIYTVDLLRHGWVSDEREEHAMPRQSVNVTLHNFEVARRALATLDLPTCGPAHEGGGNVAPGGTRVFFL